MRQPRRHAGLDEPGVRLFIHNLRRLRGNDGRRSFVRLTKRVKKGSKLVAMLHVDTGRMGRYEFSARSQAQDKPLMIGNAPAIKSFTVQ